MANIYKELYFARESIKALKLKEDQLKKQVLEAHSPGNYEVEGFDVKIAESTQQRLDTKSLKETKPEIYTEYLRDTPVTKITVKPIVT
jgi:predicted phage-related endonuclease